MIKTYKNGDKVNVIHHTDSKYKGLTGEISNTTETQAPVTEAVISDGKLPSVGSQIVYDVKLDEGAGILLRIAECWLEPIEKN